MVSGGAADRYDRVAMAFHWVIALLAIVNLFIGLFHESLLEGIRVMPIHKAIGITVLALTLGRIGWRLTHRPPHLPGDMKSWEKTFAKAVHAILYALMLLLPLTGWMMSSNPARPRPVDFFGLGTVPVLPVSGDVARAASEGHELLGWAMAALVVLHIAAALRHHFILRDRALSRMLP